jgi:hypothetical protein
MACRPSRAWNSPTCSPRSGRRATLRAVALNDYAVDIPVKRRRRGRAAHRLPAQRRADEPAREGAALGRLSLRQPRPSTRPSRSIRAASGSSTGSRFSPERARPRRKPIRARPAAAGAAPCGRRIWHRVRLALVVLAGADGAGCAAGDRRARHRQLRQHAMVAGPGRCGTSGAEMGHRRGGWSTAARAVGEVRRRFDVLYSRIRTLSTSPLYAPLRDDPTRCRGAVAHRRTTSTPNVPLIDGDDAELPPRCPSLRQRTEAIRPMCGRSRYGASPSSRGGRRPARGIAETLTLVSALTARCSSS